MATINIGWSTKSITPQRLVSLAGQFHERITDHVRDPLFATAMALEGNGSQGQGTVLVGCDLVAIDKHITDGVREKVKQNVPGLDPGHVILNASHTHTGPLLTHETTRFPNLGYRTAHADIMTPEQYSEFAIEKIAEAVKEAWEGRAPGGISTAEGYAALGFNRRAIYDDGTGVMYGQVNSVHFRGLGGPEDPRVAMLFTWDAKHELTGILFSAACTAQVVEGISSISADYFGELRILIAERWDSSIPVLGMIGAAGDLAPLDSINKHHRKYDPDADLRQLATRLLRVLEDGLDMAKDNIQTTPTFKHAVRQIDLPLRKVVKFEADLAKQELSRFKEQIAKEPDAVAYFTSLGFKEQSDIFNYYAIVDRYEHLQVTSSYPIELHVLRLGNAALVTNPFELFTEYGLQIKARSAAELTFIAQLACGNSGYLPTADAIASGGYSTQVFSGYVGAEGGEALVDYTVETVQSHWEEED